MHEPELDRPPSDPSLQPDPPLRHLRVIVLVATTCVFLMTAAIATALLRRHPAAIAMSWAALALLIAAAVLACLGALFHFLHEWKQPLRRLVKTLAQVRDGNAPLDELLSFSGPLAPLARECHALLRDLRHHKAEIVQADRDLRQRIAQRTNAMERLIGSLRQQANRDSLTGLFNRRMFDQHLATVVDQTQAAGGDLCLLMLDLDNFKLLNDTEGHAAGDELLRTVGQIIRSSIRDQDLAFRCGGDEFVIVLPDAGHAIGQVLAQRLTSLIDALGKTHKLSRPLGLSVGLATLDELPSPRADELLAAADQRLYAVKNQRKRQSGPVHVSLDNLPIPMIKPLRRAG